MLSQALENNNFDCVADPKLQKDYDSVEMSRMVACASVCVRHLARRRPKMSQVYLFYVLLLFHFHYHSLPFTAQLNYRKTSFSTAECILSNHLLNLSQCR